MPRVPHVPYQAVVRVQAAVAAGLGDVGGVAQHPPVAGLVHPAGGAPRVAAVVAICNTGGDSAAAKPGLSARAGLRRFGVKMKANRANGNTRGVLRCFAAALRCETSLLL